MQNEWLTGRGANRNQCRGEQLVAPSRSNRIQNAPRPVPEALNIDWAERIQVIGRRFAARAAAHDDTDSFVGDNYDDLKTAQVFSAGIPESLGGGGASYAETCDIIRVLAHYCGSTALAVSMHFHLVATMVWKWRQSPALVEDLLRRVAREQMVLVSSGGSDWLQGSGTAEPVEAGYRINARKVFSSGCPAGDLLLTSAVYEDPEAGPTILHFPIDLKCPQVKILPTWHALGMRGTGSNDILIENAFVPTAAISVRRPKGRWHPAMHAASRIAIPIIFAAYIGLAESARDLAVWEVTAKRENPDTQYLAGEMENELFNARLAHARMVEIGESWQTGPKTTNEVSMARTLAAQSAVRTVEKALELVGGRAFYRSLGLERVYRDVQAARFHPMPEKAQQRYAGRLALGLDIDDA